MGLALAVALKNLRLRLRMALPAPGLVRSYPGLRDGLVVFPAAAGSAAARSATAWARGTASYGEA